MAVNDNDRVTTRRLKQFWDIAKPWIQTLVSGAIDTSETAMESSMDTKILAAKPDYTKPNIDGQIGDGFGYNDMVGNYIHFNNYLFPQFAQFFSANGHYNKFAGNKSITTQIQYMESLYASTTDATSKKLTDFLKAVAGKLVMVPNEYWDDPNSENIEEFIQNHDNFKSYYDDTTDSLLSPVWTVGDNTYQTKIYGTPGQSSFTTAVSINGADFMARSTPDNQDGLAWIASFNKPLLDIGSCDVPDLGITESKLGVGSVTSNRIANRAVTRDKTAGDILTSLPIKKSETRGGSDTLSYFNLYGSYGDAASGSFRVTGFDISGTYSELITPETGPYYRYITEIKDANTQDVLGFSFNQKTFSMSNSITFKMDYPLRYGTCYLKTDDGFYKTLAECKAATVGRYEVRYEDPTFATHLSEANAHLIASLPYSPPTT